MSTEHEPQGEERSLVTQNTLGTDLATSESRRILRAVHFSNEFPARVMRVNEAFKTVAPVLDGISITLIPGKTPRIYAEPEYERGFVVEINSNIRGNAQLDIKALTGFEYTWGVTIEQLQKFLVDIAPDKEARIHAEPKMGFEENITPLDMAIPSITPELLAEIDQEHEVEDREGNIQKVDGLHERDSFEIQLEGQERIPLFKLFLAPGYLKRDNLALFYIEEMHYKGFTDQVESVMDKVVNHLFIPASPKESPETQG